MVPKANNGFITVGSDCSRPMPHRFCRSAPEKKDATAANEHFHTRFLMVVSLAVIGGVLLRFGSFVTQPPMRAPNPPVQTACGPWPSLREPQ